VVTLPGCRHPDWAHVRSAQLAQSVKTPRRIAEATGRLARCATRRWRSCRCIAYAACSSASFSCCWPICCPRLSKSRDDDIDRGLFYVAMTRAEDMLAILHSGSSSYVEELYRALGTVPP